MTIVHNFNFMSIAFMPSEADAPLIVDTNTVLSLPVALQCFKPIAGRRSHFC